MAINFPEVSEIRLGKAPLVEVVCQVRFPPILRISEKDREPVEFQDEIRESFPIVEVEHGFLVRLPGIGSGGTPSAEVQSKIYRFRSSDRQTTISLAADFYAVSTNRYTHWHDFAQQLSMADQAVQKVYKPAYATRIGLRYVNRLTPENTGCQSLHELYNLLNPELTTYARSDGWSDPREMQFRLLLTDDPARLSLRTGHGYGKDDLPYFLLDFDYFEEGELPLTDIVDRCDRYHELIYRAFRWCIPEEKLVVFDPITSEEAHGS